MHRGFHHSPSVEWLDGCLISNEEVCLGELSGWRRSDDVVGWMDVWLGQMDYLMTRFHVAILSSPLRWIAFVGARSIQSYSDGSNLESLSHTPSTCNNLMRTPPAMIDHGGLGLIAASQKLNLTLMCQIAPRHNTSCQFQLRFFCTGIFFQKKKMLNNRPRRYIPQMERTQNSKYFPTQYSFPSIQTKIPSTFWFCDIVLWNILVWLKWPIFPSPPKIIWITYNCRLKIKDFFKNIFV